MQVYARVVAAAESSKVLENPPPLTKHYWNSYREVLPLLSQWHTGVLCILNERYREETNLVRSTNVSAEMLSHLVTRGGGYMTAIDSDLKSLKMVPAGNKEVSDYHLALTLLRANISDTLRHRPRLKGEVDGARHPGQESDHAPSAPKNPQHL